ncbi:MAG: glycosyl transferase [Candidatus Nealsonbacteria bacterium CG_4_10_14_0_2_um_filter_38_17]|uniref:Glycosyl transferase n=2 Tax=Candidatus Nealsoniibacteriota TaxID=1817911 RepID=A0A2M7UX26_9BACT|nr:MAG: glycosyl transferase [Candidatus Nealsonbacteria bacterium CG_4_10_14_0_2_um_filter_38_17]
MKKLKIAQVAPLWFSVPPKKYGGTEWIVYNLCEGLTKLGHRVVLFASGDSKVPCKLIATHPRCLIEEGISWQDHTYNLLNLTEAFKRAKEFDIIHTHIDLWEVYFTSLVKTTCLHTIHNPLYSTQKKDSRLSILSHFKNQNFIAISKAQKKLSRIKLNFAAVIYNGIRIEELKFNEKPKDYFVWAARIDKYKGIENAIEIAKRARVKLVLAGRLDPTQKEYFEKKIKPHLGKQIKYVGEYSREEKSDFFGQAKALLYPIEWHEPFGLNMVEAMACGTPVIAFRMGSVPEVVKDGKTGFIVKNIKEAVEAVKNIDQIKREDCRVWVEENFTTERMVKNYEKLYYNLL